MKQFIIAGCPVCGGTMNHDLEDPDWYRCTWCAREYLYTRLMREQEKIKKKHDVYDLVDPALAVLMILMVLAAGALLN